MEFCSIRYCFLLVHKLLRHGFATPGPSSTPFIARFPLQDVRLTSVKQLTTHALCIKFVTYVPPFVPKTEVIVIYTIFRSENGSVTLVVDTSSSQENRKQTLPNLYAGIRNYVYAHHYHSCVGQRLFPATDVFIGEIFILPKSVLLALFLNNVAMSDNVAEMFLSTCLTHSQMSFAHVGFSYSQLSPVVCG